MHRRRFLSTAGTTVGFALAAPAFAKMAGLSMLSHKERVDRALYGQDLDRPPFTSYRHYSSPTAQLAAQDHLDFHRTYKTDIVKVMNDFGYPPSTTGNWYELKPIDTPFPKQLATLKAIRDGLNGDAYFIDTIFAPFMTAALLFAAQRFPNFATSPGVMDQLFRELRIFRTANPDQWHTALDAITRSTLNHIQQIKDIGASGALVTVFNAASSFGSVADYERDSRPYDQRVFEPLTDTKLSFLHLHNLERPFIDQFKDFNAPVVHYSLKTSGITISEMRAHFSQAIAGGVDEIDYEKLTTDEIKRQWIQAREQAGAKYIAVPGCSLPNASTPEAIARFPRSLGI